MNKPHTNSEFISIGSNVCPVCRSLDLHFEITDLDGPEAWTDTQCRACGSTWQAIWQLAGYRGLALRAGASSNLQDVESIWQASLSDIFLDIIPSSSVPELISELRSFALYSLWADGGVPIPHCDDPVGDKVGLYTVSAMHIGTPRRLLYGLVSAGVVDRLDAAATSGLFALPPESVQSAALLERGYKVLCSSPSDWRFLDEDGLAFPKTFSDEEAARRAAFLHQSAILPERPNSLDGRFHDQSVDASADLDDPF